MRDSTLDPDTNTTPRTGVYDRSRKSGWGWGIGGLIAVLALIGLFVWGWEGEELVATGAVAPPVATVPATPAARP